MSALLMTILDPLASAVRSAPHVALVLIAMAALALGRHQRTR